MEMRSQGDFANISYELRHGHLKFSEYLEYESIDFHYVIQEHENHTTPFNTIEINKTEIKFITVRRLSAAKINNLIRSSDLFFKYRSNSYTNSHTTKTHKKREIFAKNLKRHIWTYVFLLLTKLAKKAKRNKRKVKMIDHAFFTNKIHIFFKRQPNACLFKQDQHGNEKLYLLHKRGYK